MKRNGKTLTVLPDGAPRRLSDGRNAWRKMNDEQRAEFLRFLASEFGATYPDEFAGHLEIAALAIEATPL